MYTTQFGNLKNAAESKTGKIRRLSRYGFFGLDTVKVAEGTDSGLHWYLSRNPEMLITGYSTVAISVSPKILRACITFHTLNLQTTAAALMGKIGVLLVNTGTPEGYTYFPMRSFLAEFLKDQRMIELPRLVWWPILYSFVLTVRPFRKAKCYKSIWDMEKNEAPLRSITRQQAFQLASRFKNTKDGEYYFYSSTTIFTVLQQYYNSTANSELELFLIEVEWAFRYGNPSISSKIQLLKEKGCDRLLLFPLFPQYAAATTASVVDEVFRCLSKQRYQMSLRVIPPYFNSDAYITAIVKKVLKELTTSNFSPEALIFSYHGLPVKYCLKGDPYAVQCQETSYLLGERLSLGCPYITGFQSRYGYGKWLKPYTEDVIIDLAKSNTKKLLVLAPGFASDCLETVEEIAIEMAEKFRGNGGQEFFYISCLNDSQEGIDMIESLIKQHSSHFLN